MNIFKTLRLSHLTSTLLESDLFRKIELSDVTADFAEQKSRKKEHLPAKPVKLFLL